MIDPVLAQAAREYHEYHGDTDIKPVRLIRFADNSEFLLVRVKNEAGKPISCLDSVFLFQSKAVDCSEFLSAPRSEEEALIEECRRFVEEGEDDAVD